jgi:translation initiation factor 2 alpha subunit (eIF-2alpha)
MSKTAKLTKTQQEAMDKAMRLYNDAQMSFEDWFMHSEYANTYGEQYDSFEDAVEKNYRWFAKRDRKNDQEGYIRERVEWIRGKYEEFRKGIVYMYVSSNTLRALEKKGYIKIIVDGGRLSDKAQLLCI